MDLAVCVPDEALHGEASSLGISMVLQPKTDDAPPAPLTTGQVARRFKITLQTLHFYEDEGVIKPARDNGRRIYDNASIARLSFVVEHRRLGLSIKRIAQLLASSSLLMAVAPMLEFPR